MFMNWGIYNCDISDGILYTHRALAFFRFNFCIEYFDFRFSDLVGRHVIFVCSVLRYIFSVSEPQGHTDFFVLSSFVWLESTTSVHWTMYSGHFAAHANVLPVQRLSLVCVCLMLQSERIVEYHSNVLHWTNYKILTYFPALGFETKIEGTFYPKATLLSQATEYKEQSQSMEVDEGAKKYEVVYRPRKMRCTGTQTLWVARGYSVFGNMIWHVKIAFCHL